ncbi:MAG: hypothetical protein HRU11_00345 [Parvularculaceae bacterium]|nr:hypothetical protein [Parvularculaceae bacterium]
MNVRLFKARALLGSSEGKEAEAEFPFGLGTSGVHEVAEAAYGDHPSALGFVLSAAREAGAKSLLWITRYGARREHGTLIERWAASALGKAPPACFFVEPSKPDHALWVAEEAIKSRAVSLVLAETPLPSFTASRRLSLASEQWGTPAILLLPHSAKGTSAAQARWRVAAAPSAPNLYDPQAPGEPLWQVTLERCRAAPHLVGHTYRLGGNHAPLSGDQVDRLAPHKVATGASPYPFLARRTG